MSKNAKLEYVREWQKKLDSQYSTLKDKRSKARKYLEADPSIVAIFDNRSKITTTDFQDAIDDTKPAILEMLCGKDEPLILDPDSAKDVESTKKLQVLGNANIKRKNPWFRLCSDFLDDSMSLQFGAIKYEVIDETKEIQKLYENLSDDVIRGLLLNPGWEKVSDETVDNVRKTVIKQVSKDWYVRLSGVPSERLKFPLDTRNFKTCPITIEEVRLYEHQFIEAYGQKVFNRIKNAKDALDSAKPDPAWSARFKHVGGLDYLFDKKEDKYKAYEACFYWEGKPWFLSFAADTVISDEENKYGRPNYEGGSPFLMAHALIGKGYFDVIKTIQENRTYIDRNIYDTVTMNNFRRMIVNLEATGLNIDDYENNSATNALVRATGVLGPENIMMEPKNPLGAEMLQFREILLKEKDGRLPVSRAYAGLEGGPDEKTYRGKQLKYQRATQKILMMMRSYMEEVFAPLFQDVLDCIAKFMPRPTIVRYLNEDYEIDPVEIVCKYSIIVNVGLGSHDKNDLVVKLQQAIQIGMNLMQTGIVTAQNLSYMYSELVKAMGFLNTTDFVTDPKLKELVVQFMQMIMQLLPYLSQIPDIGAMIPQLQQMVAQIEGALGIQPEKGGMNTKGTQPGMETPEQPMNFMNPENPQTTVTGGGYFA